MLYNINIVSEKVHVLGKGKQTTTRKDNGYDPVTSCKIADKIADNLAGYRDDGASVVTGGEMSYVLAAMHGKGGINYGDDTLVRLGDLRDAVGVYCSDFEIKANKETKTDSRLVPFRNKKNIG